MPETKKKFKVEKRHFTFFGGIAMCLLSVVLILNIGYPARARAFPLAYLFGLGSYVFYLALYGIGLYFFFREKTLKIKLNNFFFGGLIIFISALMIATLIVTKDAALDKSFATTYRNVIYGIDGLNSKNAYWKASFINLFRGNNFGGGLVGYTLVGLCNTVFKGTGGTWAIAIIIAVLGLFVLFFPYIRKAISGNTAKTKKAKKEEQEEQEDVVDSDSLIASARDIDHINEPTPVIVQSQPSTFEKPTDLGERHDEYRPDSSLYSGSSNFVPAMFSKYLLKPQIEKAQPAESPAMARSVPQPAINEQMMLDFDAKPELNEQLVTAKPEFVEPTPSGSSMPVNRPQPVQAQPAVQQVERKPIKWVPPSTALLEDLEVKGALDLNNNAAEERMVAINEVFDNFHVGAKCISYVVGPSVTRYNIEYASNVSVRAVEKLVDDISIRLGGVNARFESVVEGQRYSGLEIPNIKITPVSFKEVFEQLPDVKSHPLAVMFGKSIDGTCIGADFDEFPHVLVAGTTGSGKSIYNHSLICTLISRNSPEDLRLVLIDPKQVELSKYEDLPHLLCPIINDANLAKLTLSKLVDEMNRRYGVLKATGCSNIKQYNELREDDPSLEKLPFIVVFVDEYADLVDVCKDISGPIVSIAQKARAAGIHMLIATQRPSTNIITGTIKGNLPTRIALAVASYVDSSTILNEGGAEKLLGKGDMLVLSPLVSRVGMVRLQGCFIQNKEILRIVGYLREHYPVYYDPNFCNLEQEAAQAAGDVIGSPEFAASQEAGEEAKYQSVKEWVMANEYMSMSKIQRECGVGFNRAGKFFKRLQTEGVIATEVEGNKGCPVLMKDKFYDGSADTDIPVSTDQSDY